jgi:hypothetical protein
MPVVQVPIMFLLVVGLVSAAFYSSYTSPVGHSVAQVAATGYGFLSALAWGLSVMGGLIWTRLGFISSPVWNSWFNFIAAVLAAIAVGYAAI